MLEGHGGVVWGLSFSPDGRKLATATARANGSVTIWDLAGGQPSSRSRRTQGPSSASRTPDGERLVSADDGGGVTIWNLRTGKAWLSLPARLAAATGVAWSGAGHRVACAARTGP